MVSYSSCRSVILFGCTGDSSTHGSDGDSSNSESYSSCRSVILLRATAAPTAATATAATATTPDQTTLIQDHDIILDDNSSTERRYHGTTIQAPPRWRKIPARLFEPDGDNGSPRDSSTGDRKIGWGAIGWGVVSCLSYA